jgi:hypothetical protein
LLQLKDAGERQRNEQIIPKFFCAVVIYKHPSCKLQEKFINRQSVDHLINLILVKNVKFHKTLEVKIYIVLDLNVGGVPHRRYSSLRTAAKIPANIFASNAPARYTA